MSDDGAARPEGAARELTRRGPEGSAPRGGRLRRLTRSSLLRVLRPYTAHQQSVDSRMLDAIEDLERRLREQERLQLGHVTEDLLEGLESLRSRLAGMEDATSGIRAVPYVAPGTLEQFREPDAGVVLGYRGGSGAADEWCAGFAKAFRGPEERVAERRRVYSALLEAHAPVLEVEHATANEHLEGLPDGELGGVLSAHVIEHMRHEEVVRFLRLAHAKLKPGGLLVAEAMNPHAPHALKTFWVDPTHRHPVFPEVTLVLCRLAGFESAYVFHPLGSGHVEDDRYRESEYAVVAKKA